MTKQQRTKRDQRSSNPTPIRLTERDVQIVKAVYECRVLTTQHLMTLFFPSMHQAYARLSALYHHGFLDRRFLGVYIDKMNTPILYVLDRRGAELLQGQLGLDVEWSSDHKQVGIQFLEHLMGINNVRVAIMKASKLSDQVSLVEWRGEGEMKADYDYVTIHTDRGKPDEVSVIPDSYFVLDTPQGRAHFFLELDRGTMTTKRFKTKIEAYQRYYLTGAYQERFQTKSLRILTVTTSQVRLDNLKSATENAGGKLRYWFTTLDRITPNQILYDPIWQLATETISRPLIE